MSNISRDPVSTISLIVTEVSPCGQCLLSRIGSSSLVEIKTRTTFPLEDEDFLCLTIQFWNGPARRAVKRGTGEGVILPKEAMDLLDVLCFDQRVGPGTTLVGFTWPELGDSDDRQPDSSTRMMSVLLPFWDKA